MSYNHNLLYYLAVNCSHLSDDPIHVRAKCVICGIPSNCRRAMYSVPKSKERTSYIMCTSCIEMIAHYRQEHFRKAGQNA